MMESLKRHSCIVSGDPHEYQEVMQIELKKEQENRGFMGRRGKISSNDEDEATVQKSDNTLNLNNVYIEIIRCGILSVDKGQFEAAKCLEI